MEGERGREGGEGWKDDWTEGVYFQKSEFRFQISDFRNLNSESIFGVWLQRRVKKRFRFQISEIQKSEFRFQISELGCIGLWCQMGRRNVPHPMMIASRSVWMCIRLVACVCCECSYDYTHAYSYECCCLCLSGCTCMYLDPMSGLHVLAQLPIALWLCICIVSLPLYLRVCHYVPWLLIGKLSICIYTHLSMYVSQSLSYKIRCYPYIYIYIDMHLDDGWRGMLIYTEI